MRQSKFFAALLLALLVCGVAHADDYDLAYKRLGELGTITTEDSGDKIPVWDATDNDVKMMPIVRSGDLYFRSTLLVSGRGAGGALAIASSTTGLTAANLAYATILKSVGGNSSLDETDGGTRLVNGTAGQMITFILTGLMTDGSWIITPVTKTGFIDITMDTKGDIVTLLYVNDTVGWIIVSNTGATITQA